MRLVWCLLFGLLQEERHTGQRRELGGESKDASIGRERGGGAPRQPAARVSMGAAGSAASRSSRASRPARRRSGWPAMTTNLLGAAVFRSRQAAPCPSARVRVCASWWLMTLAAPLRTARVPASAHRRGSLSPPAQEPAERRGRGNGLAHRCFARFKAAAAPGCAQCGAGPVSPPTPQARLAYPGLRNVVSHGLGAGREKVSSTQNKLFMSNSDTFLWLPLLDRDQGGVPTIWAR